MEIVTKRPLRLSGNPGGQLNIEMNKRMLISDDIGAAMIDRGMAEEIKPDIIAQEKKKTKKGE